MPESTHDNESCGKIAHLGGTVKRTAHKYLAHLKRNWAGGGKGKAIVSAEMLALLLIVRAIGGGTPQHSSARTGDTSSFNLPGNALVAMPSSLDTLSKSAQHKNKSITSLEVSKELDKGLIHIGFILDPPRLDPITCGDGTILPDSGLIWNGPLLIRLFDANGNHLAHFTTKEQFASRDSSTFNRGMLTMPVVISEDNHTVTTTYPVNAQDLERAEMVEVGFTSW